MSDKPQNFIGICAVLGSFGIIILNGVLNTNISTEHIPTILGICVLGSAATIGGKYFVKQKYNKPAQ